MISVLNHRQRLSGNKVIILWMLVLLSGACSPKIKAPVKLPSKKEEVVVKKEPVKEVPEKPAKKVEEKAHIASIALILPFDLQSMNIGSSATSAGIKNADLAIDYYQGFKMALDSLTAQGYDFKLQVFDSRDDRAKLQALAFNPALRLSDLIVGPVFPDGIKKFSEVSVGLQKLVVSPLSPASPSEFKNSNLVTMIPPLEYHAWRAAEFIQQAFKPKKIFILKSGYSEDNKYNLPFLKAVDSLGSKNIKVIENVVVRGDLKRIIPQLSATEENVFVIPSTNQAFLQVTLRALDDLATSYPITLIGHPSWSKATYLRPEILEKLKTRVTASDFVNYKSAAIINFIRQYRKVFDYEPSEYAIKGFDEGFYFGQLLAENPDNLKKLDKHDFKSMHNKFEFIWINGQGWINKHVYMMKYENFELKPEE
ncbi:MAG: ABC transporter substrate-binding protein [Sphingobacteriaceae bacterium]